MRPRLEAPCAFSVKSRCQEEPFDETDEDQKMGLKSNW